MADIPFQTAIFSIKHCSNATPNYTPAHPKLALFRGFGLLRRPLPLNCANLWLASTPTQNAKHFADTCVVVRHAFGVLAPSVRCNNFIIASHLRPLRGALIDRTAVSLRDTSCATGLRPFCGGVNPPAPPDGGA